MPKRTVRIVVPHSGDLREIFSLREKSNGELTIIYRLDGFPSPEGLNRLSRADDRTSIHRSDKSNDGGFQIKTTSVYDGTDFVLEQYYYVKPHDGYAIAPIRGTIIGDLASPGYSLSRNTKNFECLFPEILMSGSMARGALFYCIIVSRSGLNISDFENIPLPVREFKFTKNTVFVVYGIFRTRICGAMTSFRTLNSMPALVNGVENEFEIVDSPLHRSYEPQELWFSIMQYMNACIEGQQYVIGDDKIAKPDNMSSKDIENIKNDYLTIYRSYNDNKGISIIEQRAKLLSKGQNFFSDAPIFISAKPEENSSF